MFQSAQGTSTTESGLRYIALVGPQIVSLIIVGGIVSKWGYYVGDPDPVSMSSECRLTIPPSGTIYDNRGHHL